MIKTYRNEYGDGTVENVEIDIGEPADDDTEADWSDISEALEEIA